KETNKVQGLLRFMVPKKGTPGGVALRISALIAVIAIGFAGWSARPATAAAKADVAGHVYVNNNTAPFNSISAFDRHSDGTLTPTAGSPFVTGGSGGSGGSQGALQMSAEGRYLLAVDAGSDQISVLRIRAAG